MQSREAIRLHYRPAIVRTLFVGEAPPASGRFFYNRDSGLYRAVRDAFHGVDPSIDDENFLSRFQASGCYLVDACPQPVDRMNHKTRREICIANEPQLASTIHELHPETIVSLLLSIRPSVERAAKQASWQGTFLDLPYPGRWIRHREVFVGKLTPYLRNINISA